MGSALCAHLARQAGSPERRPEMTTSDILHNADLFKTAYPNWPAPEPATDDQE